jgi:ADP-heptose:LPS heptosyltransferase
VQSLRGQFPFRGSSPFAALTPTGNERTRILLQAILGGASTRVGFTVQPELFRVPLTFDNTKSQIANNLRIVEALGHKATHFEPKIFFSEQELAGARELLTTCGIGQGQPIAVFVTQTSVTQRKSWRPERFRETAIFLKERYGAHILFVGTASEAPAIDELRSVLPFATTNIAGKTNLPQLAALMSLCTVGVTLDTGPLHVGRAAGLPMVIIAPAWSPPIEWLPVDNDRFRIFKNADMRSAPPDYIIDEVSVAEVVGALEDLLSRDHR